MAHAALALLHVIAVAVFPVALFVTIPLHLVYALLARRQVAPDATGHGRVHCPECHEWVLPEARRCKHCGATLQPSSAEDERTRRLVESLRSRSSQR